jgi:hypothetical protein
VQPPPSRRGRNARLVDPLGITSGKIDITRLQHALFVGVSRLARFVTTSVSLRICVINASTRALEWCIQ